MKLISLVKLMQERTSIVPAVAVVVLLLLVGGARGRMIRGYQDDKNILQPIMSRSQERRICAELCMSGLGGGGCGDDCVDLTPQGLPLQLSKPPPQNKNATGAPSPVARQSNGNPESSVTSSYNTRHAACELLCNNSLGYPLCNCKNNPKTSQEVDFVQICGFFCVTYEYRIFGCQACDVYKNLTYVTGGNEPIKSGYERHVVQAAPAAVKPASSSGGSYFLKKDIDWGEWCRQMCAIDEGGAACNCDILPMAL